MNAGLNPGKTLKKKHFYSQVKPYLFFYQNKVTSKRFYTSLFASNTFMSIQYECLLASFSPSFSSFTPSPDPNADPDTAAIGMRIRIRNTDLKKVFLSILMHCILMYHIMQ
jgi:hypothetical protein